MSPLPEIPDYVLQVLARLGPITTESDGWVFPCPCISHSGKGVDRNPSLRVTIGDQGKIIIHCRTGCSTQDVLSSVGLSFTDLYCPKNEEAATSLLFNKETNTITKSYEVINQVYAEVINQLSLHQSHLDDLSKRGIDVNMARGLAYKSLLTSYDEDVLLKRLNSLFGEKLLEVPGFQKCEVKENYYSFAINPKGLLIPIRNTQNQIIAIKTRRSFTPKYIIWSSRKGQSAGMPVHCPLTAPSNLTVVRITEGEIKADIAWRKSGVYTISIPGVNSWPAAIPVLEELNCKKVILSFDYPDVLSKGGVARLLRLFAEVLSQSNYEVGFETWDITNAENKGIDDALVSNLTPQVIWGTEALNKIREIHSGENQVINFFNPGEPEPFPMDTLPPMLRDFVSQHSQSLQCPEDFMVVGILAVAARCLGTSRAIQLDSKWFELPNQFFCIVAPPSSGKSPACKRVLAPIRKLQIEDANRYIDAKSTYREEMEEFREEVKRANRNHEARPESPDKPRAIIHYWINDITVETVAKRLHDNGHNLRKDPSLLYFRDEILGWIKSLNAYRGGKGGDKEFFLSAWSNEDVKVDRKTDDETIIISCPALTVLGGIQPDLVSDLNENSGKDDGFYARILFCFPNTIPGFDPISSFIPDNDLEEFWEVICRRLLSLSLVEAPNQNPDTVTKIFVPKKIPLSPEAREVWNQWHIAENILVRDRNFPKKLESAWGKHRAILARIALVMHYLHNASMPEGDFDIDQPITAPAMQCAIKILAYFRSHYQRVLNRMGYTPHERKVELFVQYIINHHNGSISLRDIYRGRLFDCKGKEDAEALCKLASDRGFGSMEKVVITKSTTSKPVYMFIVQNT